MTNTINPSTIIIIVIIRDGDELVIDRIGVQRRAEQQRLLTEIAQSTQDASDELRLMNDYVENLTREVRGTKEAIKSLTDVLRK